MQTRTLITSSLDDFAALKVHLCADEYITVTIDPRTGHITLRDTGGLAASGRGPRYALFSDRINENPFVVYNILVGARFDVSIVASATRHVELRAFNRPYLNLLSKRLSILDSRPSAHEIFHGKVSRASHISCGTHRLVM